MTDRPAQSKSRFDERFASSVGSLWFAWSGDSSVLGSMNSSLFVETTTKDFTLCRLCVVGVVNFESADRLVTGEKRKRLERSTSDG